MRLWPNENKRVAHGSVTTAPLCEVTQEQQLIFGYKATRNVAINIGT